MAWPYTYKWQQASKGFLKKHPWCAFHLRRRIYITAVVVDHKTPHRNDMTLFWDRGNWQGLCKHCHDSVKQRLEKSGTITGSDESGLPIDPSHHWHQG